MAKKEDGGPAYPTEPNTQPGYYVHHGMSLRDHFAGQAMANPTICTGTATDYQINRWFGDRGGITRAQIVAAQAHEYADAMLAERAK